MYCKDHNIDECRELAAHQCGKCGGKGHTRGRCTNTNTITLGEFIENYNAKPQPGNTWAAMVDKKIADNMREKVEAANIAAKIKEDKEKADRIAARRAAAAERQQKAVDTAIRWRNHMAYQHGYRWFDFVNEALMPFGAARKECLSLLWKEQKEFEEEAAHAAYEYEDMLDAHTRKCQERKAQRVAEYEHNEATMSPIEFARWARNREREEDEIRYEMEDYLESLETDADTKYQNFTADCPEYYLHYKQTGIMLDPRDKELERKAAAKK